MPCEIIQTPTGTVIACSRGPKKPSKCCVCGKKAERLCDARGPQNGLCSKPLCWDHTTQAKTNGKTRDYCPEHKGLAKGGLSG